MTVPNLRIKTKNNSYNIVLGNNKINNLLKILKGNSINFNKCLLIIDNKVPKIFIKKIKTLLKNKNIFQYSFTSSEINKN